MERCPHKTLVGKDIPERIYLTSTARHRSPRSHATAWSPLVLAPKHPPVLVISRAHGQPAKSDGIRGGKRASAKSSRGAGALSRILMAKHDDRRKGVEAGAAQPMAKRREAKQRRAGIVTVLVAGHGFACLLMNRGIPMMYMIWIMISPVVCMFGFWISFFLSRMMCFTLPGSTSTSHVDHPLDVRYVRYVLDTGHSTAPSSTSRARPSGEKREFRPTENSEQSPSCEEMIVAK